MWILIAFVVSIAFFFGTVGVLEYLDATESQEEKR